MSKYLDASGLQTVWNKIKGMDASVVHKSGDESISGTKTFSDGIVTTSIVSDDGFCAAVYLNPVQGNTTIHADNQVTIQSTGISLNTDNGGADIYLAAGGDIILDPDNKAYYGTQDDVNEIATKGDVANASPWDKSAAFPSAILKGSNGIISGPYGVTEGNGCTAGGYAHAEGNTTRATGANSHSEGSSTQANAQHSHAEGWNSVVASSATAAHVEGRGTRANNQSEHAEGNYNVSHNVNPGFPNAGNTLSSIGCGTSDSSRMNAVEVMQNGDFYLYGIGNYVGKEIHTNDASIKTLQQVMTEYPFSAGAGINSAVLKGGNNIASGTSSVAEGAGTQAKHDWAHSEGEHTYVTGKRGHSEGDHTIAGGTTTINSEDRFDDATATITGTFSNCHAEGKGARANANNAHAEGVGTLVTGTNSHGEGYHTEVSGTNAHGEGDTTAASGQASHSEGYHTVAGNLAAHSEGYETEASGNAGHSEGVRTYANGDYSHAEGSDNEVNFNTSHVEGYMSYIGELTGQVHIPVSSSGTGSSSGGGTPIEDEETSIASHAEGYNSFVGASFAHAEGNRTTAAGASSHAEGYCTETHNVGEHAEGVFNKSNHGSTSAANTVHSIGIGAVDIRKNAIEVMQNGDFYLFNVGGFDGTNATSATTKTLQGVMADAAPMVEVTYAELKSMRDNSQLKAGAQYRITDYYTTTVQENTQSVDHQFDIIVVADDEKTLNESARACLHEGDTYFSGANAKLDAWELKYCLDNDTARFAWADENGTGVIYYMKDEWNNECPYDFKNIRFKRKLTEGQYAPEDGVDTWVYTFNAYDIENDIYEDAWRAIGKAADDGCNACYGNIIKSYCYDYDRGTNSQCYRLNDIVFLNIYEDKGAIYFECYSNTFGNDCNHNTFGNNCSSNTFGNDCYSNTFGNDCYSNTFGNDCYSNTFGNDCNHNTFGNNCSSNTFGNKCRRNTFSNNCFSNTFGNNCSRNTFSNNCFANTFGNNCSSNTFGNDCSYNTFGDYCYSNTFGNTYGSNTFGDYCYSNTFGNHCRFNAFGDYCYSNSFGNECLNNTFYEDYLCDNRIDNNFHDNDVFVNVENGNYVIYHHFKSGIIGQTFTVNGREFNESDEMPLVEIEVGINSKGEIVQYCLEDLYKGI